MSDQTTNIRLVGVGGQGILVASEVLCAVLLQAGHDVKKSEVHGMAQRGGTVNSDVRFGKKVYSPIIPEGEADVLLAFEQMEALRYLLSLRPNGVVIVNEQKILPSTAASGGLEYPADIGGQSAERAGRVICIDALSAAKEAGTVRSVNMCLLGALSAFLDIDMDAWKSVIRDRFANKRPEANLKAFEFGRCAAGGRKDGA